MQIIDSLIKMPKSSIISLTGTFLTGVAAYITILALEDYGIYGALAACGVTAIGITGSVAIASRFEHCMEESVELMARSSMEDLA